MAQLGAGVDDRAFFVAGGTLPLNSASYLERAADKALLRSLEEGRFCYVLNSRQMGKSSLCVRTMARLAEDGVKCAFIDITKIGGRNVTPEQWYAGMAVEVGRTLGLRNEILDYWKTQADLSPMQRFFGALRDVVLERIEGKTVVFVDEIDSTRSLPFSTDEFFAGVRECFNRRVQDHEFNRLTFCFLGVAVPSDLIHDARTTPFNIGDRIYLKDFTLEELQPLASHLGPNGDAVLRRVHYWTNGHPFLTQSVCRALMQEGALSETSVDALIQRDLLEPKVRETNINLSDVGNRVLNGYADSDEIDKFRADILSAYDKALSGKQVLQDDEANRVNAVLKLSGLMRSEGNQLKVRNRIYEKAFDRAWIVENMPGQELRRQRLAYYAGVARTTLIAAAIIAVIGYLAINNFRLARAAEATAREMSWRAYIADMNRLPVVFAQNNVPLMKRLLADHKHDSWRGPEWDYWNGMIHDALWETPDIGQASVPILSPDEKLMLTLVGRKVSIIDAETGQINRSFDLPDDETGAISWLGGSARILKSNLVGGGYILDLATNSIVKKIPLDTYVEGPLWNTLSVDGKYAIASKGPVLGVLDLETLEMGLKSKNRDSPLLSFLADGRHIIEGAFAHEGERFNIVDLRTGKVKRSIEIRSRGSAERFSADGEFLTHGTESGHVRRYRMSDGKLLWEVKAADGMINGISLSSDGTLVGASTRNRAAYLIRATNSSAKVIRSFTDAQLIQVRRDGSRVYTSYWITRAYDPNDPPPIQSVDIGDRTVGVRYLRPLDLFLMLDQDKVNSFKVIDGQMVVQSEFRIPSGELWDSDKERPWIMTTDGKKSRIQDVVSKTDLMTLDLEPGNTDMISLGDDRLILRTEATKFVVYEVKTGKSKVAFTWPDSGRSMDISRDGKLLCVRSESGRVGVVDTNTWEILWSKNEHGRPTLTGTFSKDNSLLVTTSHDDSAIVWDVAAGKMVCRLVGHAQSVTAADFLPGNTRVVTVSDDRTIRIWDAKSGTELTTLGDAGDYPSICLVTLDERHIVTVNRAGILKYWPLFQPGAPPKSGDPK